MTLRTLFALLLAAILLFGIVVIIGLALFVYSGVTVIFPADAVRAGSDALRLLLIEQSAGLFAFAALFLIVLFILMNVYVIAPLKKLITAMESLSSHGEQGTLPNLREAPKELQTLGTVFAAFVERMAETHKKDVEVSRVKSDFISTAAHQLRTPLTGIRWALEALEKQDLTEEQHVLVKNATDASHDLVGIVGTLLDITSIESGKYNYAFTSVDVAALLIEVAQDFAPLAGKSGVSLFYAKEEETVPAVRADRDRIKWVLNNLVENALVYTPSGGAVRLSAEENAGRIFIRIKDTGIGIPLQERGNIFERFYRGSNAVTKSGKGKGLGLYIARTIATDHGGDLHFVANQDGPGTTFVLSLPIAS